MKNLKIILFVALTTCLTFSCGDDDSDSDSGLSSEGGPFEISELTGNWEATSAFFWRDSDGLNIDIVADGGSVSLTVQSNGSCTFTIDPFDRDAYMVSGEMLWGSYEGDEALVVVWDDSSRSSFRWIELNDTTFDLGCTSVCGDYDFNNDGTSEASDLSFSFARN